MCVLAFISHVLHLTAHGLETQREHESENFLAALEQYFYQLPRHATVKKHHLYSMFNSLFPEQPTIVLQNQVPKGMKKSEALTQMEAALKKYTSEIYLTEDDLYEPEKKQPPRFLKIISISVLLSYLFEILINYFGTLQIRNSNQRPKRSGGNAANEIRVPTGSSRRPEHESRMVLK